MCGLDCRRATEEKWSLWLGQVDISQPSVSSEDGTLRIPIRTPVLPVAVVAAVGEVAVNK